MPVYEYTCWYCGYQGEQSASYEDSEQCIPCPNCNALMARVISAPAVIYVGGKPSAEVKE